MKNFNPTDVLESESLLYTVLAAWLNPSNQLESSIA
jgi:hypothetical protein